MPKRVLLVLLCLLSLELRFVPAAHAQWATNTSHDLFGENWGDFILLQFDPTDSATWYEGYVGYSSTGPWSLLFEDDDPQQGGAKVHMTPEARTTDLCYKVEAQDAAGAVIKTYEPICVPKYAEKK
jgi:hypothetical protein